MTFLSITIPFMLIYVMTFQERQASEQQRRILQQNPVGPIRIQYYPYNWPSDLVKNATQSNYLNKLLNTAAQFYSDMINVTQIQGPLKFQYDVTAPKSDSSNFTALSSFPKNGILINNGKQQNLTCLYVNVPQDHILYGVNNTDLMIYVSAYPESTPYVSFSGVCVVTPRPTFAQLHINTQHIFDQFFDVNDPLQFQYYVEVVIHEMMHILGFSKDLYPFYQNKQGQFYDADDVITQANGLVFMKLPSIKSAAQDYYNCDSLPGMPMEQSIVKTPAQLVVQNGRTYIQPSIHSLQVYSSSHWQRDVINNELMTSAHVGQLMISKLSMLMLQETNWYSSVDTTDTDELYFGAGEGCDFVYLRCLNKNHGYKEYCGYMNLLSLLFVSIGCNYDYSAVSECRPLLPNQVCLDFVPVENYYCYDETNNNKDDIDLATNSNITLEQFSRNSRCFTGTIRAQGTRLRQDTGFRCLKSYCSLAADGSYVVDIQVNGFNITCSKASSGQKMRGPAGTDGSIQCPVNLTQFCTEYKPPCINMCSSNGYCLGGKCYCRDGYYGDDCGQCNGFIQNDSCINKCPPGYYASQLKCTPCDITCQSCDKPKTCLTCRSGLIPAQTLIPSQYQCLNQCQQNQYMANNTCFLCPKNCTSCVSNDICRQCEVGFLIYPLKSKVTCVDTCPYGSYQSSSSSCASCNSTNCAICNGAQGCLYCSPGYWLHFDLKNRLSQCVEHCPDGYYETIISNASTCAACSSNCIQCASKQTCQLCDNTSLNYYDQCVAGCPSGYYADQNKRCQLCSKGCSICTDQNKCLQCTGNHPLKNNQCEDGCQESQYSTDDGLGEKVCLDCSKNCQQCFGLGSCARCKKGFVLQVQPSKEQLCQSQCNKGYYEDQTHGLCSSCPADCDVCQSSKQCKTCTPPYKLSNSHCVTKCQSNQIDQGDVCQAKLKQDNPAPSPSPSIFKQKEEESSSSRLVDEEQDVEEEVNYEEEESEESEEWKEEEENQEEEESSVSGEHEISRGGCGPHCKECASNKKTCLKCFQGLNRELSDGKCVCGTSYTEVDDVCQQIDCHINCLTCSSTSHNGCLTCRKDRKLNKQTYECVCSGDNVDVGQGKCEASPAVIKTIQLTGNVVSQVTNVGTQAASLLSSFGSGIPLGQNVKLSDASQMLSYIGYKDTELFGTTDLQMKSLQGSNMPSLFQMSMSPPKYVDSASSRKKKGRLLEEVSTDDKSLQRYGKSTNALMNLLTLVLSWLVGALIFFAVLNFQSLIPQKNIQQSYSIKLCRNFQNSWRMAYSMIFVSLAQEEFFITLFAFKSSAQNSIINYSVGALLSGHILFSQFLIFTMSQQTSMQVAYAIGLYQMENPKGLNKVRAFIIHNILLLKIVDKLLVVVIAVYANKDPNYLIYLFVITLTQTLLINLSCIFDSTFLWIISFTSDLFQLTIILLFQTLGSPYEEDFRTKLNRIQILLSVFTIYKLLIFILEVAYGLLRQKSKSSEADTKKLNLELQNFVQPQQSSSDQSHQNTSDQSISDNKQQPAIGMTSKQSQWQQPSQINNNNLTDTNQFNSNTSQQSNASKASIMSYKNNARQSVHKIKRFSDTDMSFDTS